METYMTYKYLLLRFITLGYTVIIVWFVFSGLGLLINTFDFIEYFKRRALIVNDNPVFWSRYNQINTIYTHQIY